MWENWGDPFTNPYKIRDRDYWNKFWDTCKYTEKDIYLALRNINYCVNEGYYESRYISPDPCKFIQGGMIERGLSSDFEMWDYEHEEPDPNLEKVRDD
jgi:hypothetical protein